MANKEEVKIPDIEFKSKDGSMVKLEKVLEQDDYWSVRGKKAFIISHKGVEKIATAAGIKPQINTRFELEVQPTYQNAMNHQVVAKMYCESHLENSTGVKCVHDLDREFFSTGEASRYNTGARGGQYLRIMAEKRAYDRGVLRHLNLGEEINIYSEEEAEAFEQDKDKPVDEIIEKNASIINKILNATSKEDLMNIGEEIKGLQIPEDELEYLRTVWSRQYNKFNKAF